MNKFILCFMVMTALCAKLPAQEVIKGKSNTLSNVNIGNDAADNTAPLITVLEPAVKRGIRIVSDLASVNVKVKVTDASGVATVLINDRNAAFTGNDIFEATISLAYGDNTLKVKATDTRNNTAEETFQIERKDAGGPGNPVAGAPAVLGKYYALIIGNNSYLDPAVSSLTEPINDATKLYDVLTTYYTFDAANVTLLKNAKYEEIISAFDKLGNTLTSEDNLLVFYAGHGWWDEEKGLGYWLPVDAKKNSTAFWIRNSTISDFISSIKTRHTLLIADACFSGSIFKTRAAFGDASVAVNKLYDLPSRKAMTSGALKEVPDKSVFLQYLVTRLKDNKEKYTPADQLFASFRIAVMNNSANEPLYGTIQNTGDQGGEFIFIRR